MTKLYKNTGIEYIIEYEPPPEPDPPPPDDNTPAPPGNDVNEDTSSPDSDGGVETEGNITFLNCTTSTGLKGVRKYIDGRPVSGCMPLQNQGSG